jgi:hypothetical protein
MRLHEFSNPLKQYMATVRVVLRYGSTTARTIITADTDQQARAMLIRTYGDGNVLSINQVMNEEGLSEGTKTISPQELQVKSLADKAEDYKQQAKAMKARQQIAKAQQDLMKAQKKGKS